MPLAMESPLARPHAVVRRCACGGEIGSDGRCAHCRAQEGKGRAAPARGSSLRVEPADGALERDADRVAERALRGGDGVPSAGGGPAGIVQRAPASSGGTPSVGAEAAGEIRALRGGGAPLPPGERAFFESRMGHDFGRIRVHDGPGPARLARSLQARAFTHGEDVVFGAGHYAPGTAAGRGLLAHELAHTLQQPGAGGASVLRQADESASGAELTQDDLDKIEGSGPATEESESGEPDRVPPPEEEAQAKAGPGGRDTIAGPAPAGSSGRPLAASTRTRMERAFGHDFSAVRVHTGAGAHAYVCGAGAHAAALGTDIYARSDAGIERQPWLLAHELAHVVQQSGHRGGAAQAAGVAGARTSAFEREADAAASQVAAGGQASVQLRTGAATPQMYSANICGRASRQLPDFPATYISAINVDVGTQEVTLTWTGPNAASGPTGPFHCSPGAGTCGTDCNDTAASNRGGSHCTPKGTFTVRKFACALGDHPEAENATYFQTARGIAFHRYPSVPNCPASHGCVRLRREASEIIYDNSKKGTTVTVGGTWARGTCSCW